RLRQGGPAAFDRVAFMRVMAIGATDFALEHRMMMGQLKSRTHFGVALETGRRRFARINDLAPLAAAFHMKTARTVTRFAAHVLGVVALRFYPRVGRGRETF